MCVCVFFSFSKKVRLTKCVQPSPNPVCVCLCVFSAFTLWFKSEVANTEPVSLTPIFISLMFFNVYLSLFHFPPSLISLRHSLIYSFITNTPHIHSFTIALLAPHSLSACCFFTISIWSLISLPPIDKKKKKTRE